MKATDDQTKTLTQRMRTKTSTIHDKSDRLVNLKLALVLTSRELYAESIALFEPIFERLETALHRHQNHPQLKKISSIIVGEKITRSPSFREDIVFYIGDDKYKLLQQKQRPANDDDKIKPEELRLYLDHLDHLEKENPLYLVAYVYHMYMAIFAGGFIIRKMVKRAMNLKSDDGVRAFSFPPGVDTRSLRRKLKNCIDHDMSFTEKEEEMILSESNNVFVLNNRLVGTVRRTRLFGDVSLMWKRRFFFAIMFITGVVIGYYVLK